MNRKWNVFERNILILISITVIVLGLKNSIGSIEHQEKIINNLRFIDEIDGKELSFSTWEASEEKMYYLVLPSMYSEHDFNVKIQYEDDFYTVHIDGKKYQSGEVWTDYLKEDVHQLELVNLIGEVHLKKPFQLLISDNIPAIFVTVEAKDMVYYTKDYANKQYAEIGDIVMVDEDGKIVLDDTMERFKVRGNLTSELKKKPFTFTLSSSASLCGMTESKNWHLLANATDGSHIRNKIMLDWADEILDTYNPDGEFVDLYINGEYQGLYFLTETIEINENRLRMNPDSGLLLEMDLYYRAPEETNYLVTQKEHYWVVHSDAPMLKEELENVETYLNDIESALYSSEGVSEISGKKIEELLDLDSWTDTWLLKEISADHDLGNTSQFAIVENWENRNILKAGPEWDFDLTLGNAMCPWSANPRNLVAAIPNTRGIKSVSQNKWLSQMYQHDIFKDMLIQKFQQEIQPKIKRLLDYEIDSYAEEIRRAALLDSLRWNGNGIRECMAYPGNFKWGTEKDYRKYDVLEYHVEMIKDFLKEKELFLHELWNEGVEFDVIVQEFNGEGMNLELNNNIYTWIKREE